MKIIVDESVSKTDLGRFLAATRGRGWTQAQCFSIKEEHPGAPDAVIVKHLIAAGDMVVTCDRRLHNSLLAAGLASCCLWGGAVTFEAVPGFGCQKLDVRLKNLELKECYQSNSPPIRFAVLPTHPKRLKTLQTARRRIRNYFAAPDNMGEVAVALSSQKTIGGFLIGMRMRISARDGLKALDASERYLAERCCPEDLGWVAVCHALIFPLQLLLHTLPVTIYHDSASLPVSPQWASSRSRLPCERMAASLGREFSSLSWAPVSKGRHIENLRRKLATLVRSTDTNEVIEEPLEESLSRWEELSAEGEPPATRPAELEVAAPGRSGDGILNRPLGGKL